MKISPSVLLIDYETEFQEAFAESLELEREKKLFQPELARSGKLRNDHYKRGIETFAFIDTILPDILGDELVD